MIHIVTDTGASLPHTLIRQEAIQVVSGQIVFGEEAILEYPDLSSAEFSRRLQASQGLPVTIDPGPAAFIETYVAIGSRDPEGSILSLHISESLASTLQAARVAAASLPNLDIRIVDSRQVSIAQALLLMEAIHMRSKRASIDEIVARLIALRERVRTVFTLDTLEYLARGGRVSGVGRFVGDLLDLKPILTLQEGLIVQGGPPVRSRPRAIEALAQRLIEDAGEASPAHLIVGHADCLEAGQRLLDQLTSALQPRSASLIELGPGVVTHAGPGALGAACLSE